jgi:hypothetical protein
VTRPTLPEVWSAGERCRYLTGEPVRISDTTFYEVEVRTGHQKGRRLVITTSPEQAAAGLAAIRAARKANGGAR